MRIEGREGPGVLELNDVTVTSLRAGKCHSTICRCMHGSAHRRREVHTLVSPPQLEDRVKSGHREARCDARKFHRRAEEGLAHRGAILIVVVLVAIGAYPSERAKGASTVLEFRRDDVLLKKDTPRTAEPHGGHRNDGVGGARPR